VRIERVAGNLSDHYDPRANVIRLSDSTYNSTSIAAAGVAAHEAGHAVQYAQNYAPIKVRASIVNVCNIGTPLAFVFLILSFFVSYEASGTLIMIAIALYSLATVFQLITLPVEFDASKRAMVSLEATGLYGQDELSGASKVLRAAALTYVAALISSVLSLLRFVLIATSGRRRR
jgi:Zn-dependent membrane protease YugP